MALTRTSAKFNVGSTISGSGKRQVQTDFATLPGEEAPLPQWIGYGPSVKVGSDYKYEWIKDETLPITLTGVTINNSSTSMTLSVADANSIQVGQVLKLEDELVRVATINTSTGAVTFDARGMFGTTAASHTATYTIRILPPKYLDGDSFVESAKLRGDFEYNYPQQMMYEWTGNAMRTAVESYLTKGAAELAYEHGRKMVEAVKQLDADLLYSGRTQPTSSQVGSMGGIMSFISSNITNVGGSTIPLSAKNIVDTFENIVANDPSRKTFALWCNRNTGRILDGIWNQYFDRVGEPTTTALGVTVKNVSTSHGTIEVYIDQQIDNDKIFILKQDDMEICPIETDFGTGWQEFTRTPEHTNTLERSMAYWGMFSFKMMNEKRHALIKNFDTNISSYAGAI